MVDFVVKPLVWRSMYEYMCILQSFVFCRNFSASVRGIHVVEVVKSAARYSTKNHGNGELTLKKMSVKVRLHIQ